MRNLLHAFDAKSSPIKGIVNRPDYQDYLTQAADKACSAVDNGSFSGIPAENPMFGWQTVLATLTTALQLLENTGKP